MSSSVRADGSGDSRRDGVDLCVKSPAGEEELAGAEEFIGARCYGDSFGGV